jgi:hypothetical protein
MRDAADQAERRGPVPSSAADNLDGRLEVRVDRDSPPGSFLEALARLLRQARDRQRRTGNGAGTNDAAGGLTANANNP